MWYNLQNSSERDFVGAVMTQGELPYNYRVIERLFHVFERLRLAQCTAAGEESGRSELGP